MVLSFSPLPCQTISLNVGNRPEIVNCAGLQEGRLSFAVRMLILLKAGGKGHNSTLQFLPSDSGREKE